MLSKELRIELIIDLARGGISGTLIMAKIHTGETARVIVTAILANVAEDGTYPLHGGEVGYFQDEGGKWVAWDNSTCDCWVEEFDTEKEAERYALEGIIDTY